MPGLTAIPPGQSITAVILAGGKSTRFGSNKALACWNEKGSLIENVIQKAGKVCGHVALSVRDSKDYPQIHLPKLTDIIKGKGPLSGLHSALCHCRTRWIMLLACDMPLIDRHLLSYMVEINTWAPLIIPYCRGRYEPLHAIYHKSLFPLVEHLIEHNRLRMRELIDIVPRFIIRETDILKTAGSLNCLSNINTLVDFKKASKLLG